jgi:hypothetical protein
MGNIFEGEQAEGVPIRTFVSSNTQVELKEIGRTGDIFKPALQACGGDRNTAQVLLEIRGDPRFGGTPPDQRPTLAGSSQRVASQKEANRR